MGELIGFDIGLNTIKKGLRIFHVGNIAIHSLAGSLQNLVG